MDSPLLLSTVWLSIKIAFIATTINLPIAISVSYIMARKEFRGKDIVDGVINLPLVLPPVTTGYLLILVLGKYGVIGGLIYKITGISIAFTQLAAIISSMVVSLPLIIRSLRISIEMVDTKLENVAKTLGAAPINVFFRILVPLIMPGIISGAILGFARSLGEFGATITFAGNITGETRTIPLSVYSLIQVPGRENDASILVIISVVISFTAMFFSSLLNKKFNNWRSMP